MARRSKSSVGVIGLGIIGIRVVSNLREAGYDVWLWNRSPRTEPNFLSSPRDVAESATVIEFFVSDGAALLEAIENMALSLTPNHLLINHATILPEESREAARRVQQVGAKFLDAPFTGSRDAAAKGELVFYVGGDATAIEEALPILRVSAKEILPMGKVGDASAIKIATNMITGSIVQSLAEALAIVDREGVPHEKFMEALASNASRSTTSDMKLTCMVMGDFQTRFSLKHMLKDAQLSLRLAENHQLELPLASAIAASAMSGVQRGWGEDDLSSLARHYDLPGEKAVNMEPKEVTSLPPIPSNGAAASPTSAEKRGILQSFFGKK
ncbi:MAG: NAD(P)-dependent oxidoreductase [Chthoniobacterales bacterium]